MWVCEAQAWMCGNAGKSWSAARRAPRAFLFRLANEEKADEHRRYGQCYESEPFHRLPRPLMNPHVDVAMTGVHHVFPALDAVERRCRGCRTARGLGTHVSAKKGPFGRFGMGILVWTSGRRFSSSRLESARRCPMCGSRAAGPLVPERQGAFGALRCSASGGSA